MYYVGLILGKLFKHKWYILLTITYWVIMTKLEKWLNFDPSLSIFFLILYVLWLVMEIRTKKLRDEAFFTPTIRYVKWYIQNVRVFLKGER